MSDQLRADHTHEAAEVRLDSLGPDLGNRLVTLVDGLRPMAATIHRLSAAVEDESLGPREVVDIVQSDPVLVAATLAEANSGASAPPQPITTVARAVVWLGLSRTLALSTATGAVPGAEQEPPSSTSIRVSDGPTRWPHRRWRTSSTGDHGPVPPSARPPRPSSTMSVD